ncbi:MAG: helix-hairpin-helix protein [Ferruginibacter sp.]|nr:helix-hairpin-helix protein [Ferruginibacter sp.]
MKAFLFIFCLVASGVVSGQIQPPASVTEQLVMEELTQHTDLVPEDETLTSTMEALRRHPVNLNFADQKTLEELPLLPAIQASLLLKYRALFGPFLSIYELQAIPGWNLQLIKQIMPYITVENVAEIEEQMRERISGGEQQVLLRSSLQWPYSRGYRADSTGEKKYPGSPLKVLLRYRYQFKNLLQFGFTAEKDPGEEFFHGKQKWGFDFYSCHVFLRNLGKIKTLALGDFTVNFGQGLLQWMNLSFGGSANIVSVKRQGGVFKPYSSAGEFNFHRGAAITLSSGKWELNLFGSKRRLDAHVYPPDSSSQQSYIFSLQTNGLHRTISENANKKIEQVTTIGARLSVDVKSMHIAANGVRYGFQTAFMPQEKSYDRFSFAGKQLTNTSLDYSYTFKNLHFFGESAMDDNKSFAFIHGLLISLNKNAEMSILHRRISPSYHSFFSSANIQNSTVSNERGCYIGLNVRMTAALAFNGSLDLFSFPWLKFGVNKLSGGKTAQLQFIYTPNKVTALFFRYKYSFTEENVSGPVPAIVKTAAKSLQNCRLQFAYQPGPDMELRSRIEIVFFDKGGNSAAEGMLGYLEWLYHPMSKPFSANLRLQYFETDSYESRLYAFESDVLYNYSVPVFDGKGYRFYGNFAVQPTKKLACWLKIAHSLYLDKEVQGSGYDLISSSQKMQLTLQLQYKF